MYELVFIIVVISIGLFIKYAFIQESQRPYPYHHAFAGPHEDFLNWGKVNPKAGVFANLMLIGLHIYFGVTLFNPTVQFFGVLFFLYFFMFGIWVILGSMLCIAEAAEGISWRRRWGRYL